MLTIQNYQPKYNSPNFRCKPIGNVSELSQSSQKLLQDIMRMVKAAKKIPTQVVRSKRFADGSFVELQGKTEGLNVKYLRMNQRPMELDIKQNGNIEYKNKLSGDLNNLIEKYFPDIIEREQYRYI